MLDEIRKILSDGKFHDLNEIALKNNWSLHSMEAAIRRLRRPEYGSLIVQRRKYEGRIRYCALPRDAFKRKSVKPQPPPPQPPPPEAPAASTDEERLKAMLKSVLGELFNEFVAGVVDGFKGTVQGRNSFVSSPNPVRRSDANQGAGDMPGVREGSKAEAGQAAKG